MLGTFSGGGLGMGVAFTLKDEFSRTAQSIQGQMGKLEANTEMMERKISRSLNLVQTGFGTAIAGAAILAPFAMGIKHASDYEENINKLDVAFGKHAERVRSFTDNALDNFGIDKVEASNMAALYGDMATGMGFAQDKAADMSKQLVGLAGDIASFKNISHSQANTALKSIFTGETESLKNLGIVMTQTNLEAYMASKGINKSLGDLSQSEKVLLRMQFVTNAAKNAVGDFARTSEGYANSKRVFDGALKEISMTLGNIIMPIVASLMSKLTGLFRMLNSFGQTTFGKFILRSVAALGALLVVGGLALMLFGGMKFAVFKLTAAFGASTKAMIIQTIATKGLSAGLRQMGRAAWASLGPYAIIAAALLAFYLIAKKAFSMITEGSETMVRFGTILLFALGPIGWVIAAIAGIKRGFKELNESTMKKGGLIGFFTKVAGVLAAVKEIWDSYDSESGLFSISEGLANFLEDNGLLGFVTQVGTWIARIKEYIGGFMTSIRGGMAVAGSLFGIIQNKLGSVFGKLYEAGSKIFALIGKVFKPLIALFSVIAEKVFGVKGSLDGWAGAGAMVGDVLMFMLNSVLFILTVMIDTVLFVIDAFIWLIDMVTLAVNSMVAFSTAMFDVGVSFVSSIWEGIKSMWTQMVTWVKTMAEELFAPLAKPMEWIGNKLGQAWNFVSGSEEESPDTSSPSSPIRPSGGGEQGPIKVTSKTPTVVQAPQQAAQPAEQKNYITLLVDGEEVAVKMREKEELNLARS